MTVTNEELMAYADGELAEGDKARVDAALAADPALRAALEKHRRLTALLQSSYAPVLEESVPERLLQTAHVRADAPTDAPVVDLAAARTQRAALMPRNWRIPEWSAMAAALVLGVLIGGQTLGRDGPLTPTEDGLLARGALARALETQLAADTGKPVHIGLTFRSAEGVVCRTFGADRGALQGLACKEDGAWRIDMVLRGSRQSEPEFRMAAADTPPAVLARVEEKIAGEPLESEKEKAARDTGWTVQK